MPVDMLRRMALAATIGFGALALSSCDDADGPAEEAAEEAEDAADEAGDALEDAGD